jgi:hypothetical protein
MLRIVLVVCMMMLQQQYCFAQQGLYAVSKSLTTFFSKAPLEDITAVNTSATSLINTKNNEIVVRVPITKFEFPNKLMQEHFKENYLESDKYPVATFKGKINEAIPWGTPGTYAVSATGVLNIHGKDDTKIIKGILKIGDKGFELDATFKVRLENHDIKIPRLVFNKIAEEIDVNCSYLYTPYKRK